MPFMVIYRTSDGSSRYEQADAIDEAALFVERLRNSEGIDQIRIYRMEEISFAFRPYYKVELGLPERQTNAAAGIPTDVVAEPTADAAPGPVVEVEPEAPDATPGLAVDPPTSVDATVDHGTLPTVAAVPPLPPPPGADGETAGANGRRGLFGR